MRIITFLFVALLLNACNVKSGSGNIVTENRNTRDFDGVHVGGGFEVEITKGVSHRVTIEADDNLIKNIKTEVKDGILIIKTRDNSLRDAHLKAIITTPELNHIKASAGSSVKVNGSYTSAKEASYEASSGAEIIADINTPEVRTDASSSGKITLTGRTRKFRASASSGSTIDTKNLMAENSTVKGSSGATVKVYASVQLDATASSGASINYRGGGNVKQNVSSGGSVQSIQ